MRTPGWLVVLVVLLIVGVGVYGYFTTPLPFGLSNVVRTPGGQNVPQAPLATPDAPVTPGLRTAAGQPLRLGAVSLTAQAVQRGQDVTGPTPAQTATASTQAARGPVGSFTLVLLRIENDGRDPLAMEPGDFRLQDERGRGYAVDVEASRAAAQMLSPRRRAPFEATVPPGGQLETVLAFEAAPDAGALTLRAQLGYGELDLPT